MLPGINKSIHKQQPTDKSPAATKARLKSAVIRQILMMIGALLLVLALVFAVTVAWFTNVSQTGGLQFQTEAWGFDASNIKISEEGTTFRLSPGSSGFVPLSIDNGAGSTAVEAEVNISKTGTTESGESVAQMGEELQKRIYFYVDASRTYTFGVGEDVTTETVSKFYLGSEKTESYCYFIPAGEKLTLSETYYSDAPLKWEWVYDMEGYYFRGTVNAAAGADEPAVLVEEYLRPLEYDLQDAVFDLEEGTEGVTSETYAQLVSIGETPVAEYLKGIFDSDGYEGTLNLEEDGSIPMDAYVKIENRIYYKVSVDDNGYGIWAYLCNYEDVQTALEFDNSLDETSLVDATVTVKVTVRNVDQEKIEISSAEELQTALQENADQVIELNQDLNAGASVTVPESVSAVVDLNGYTITYVGEEDTYSIFRVPAGSELTLINGNLHGNEKGSGNGSVTQSVAVTCEGGKATISGITATGFDTALFVDDRIAGGNSVGSDSEVKVSGCEFDTYSSAVFVFGNGSATETKSRVIIQNSTIKSQYIGICGQGTNKPEEQLWGTELVLANSKIEGFWAGLYQPQQQSSTTITNCEIIGYTGIAVKGGTVTIHASKITGTGQHAPARASGGGFTDTGDGVYVEAAYDWSATVVLRGTDNEVTSENSYALDLFGVTGKGPGKLLVEGGAYTGKMGASAWNDIGSMTIRDGTILNGVVQDSSEQTAEE